MDDLKCDTCGASLSLQRPISMAEFYKACHPLPKSAVRRLVADGRVPCLTVGGKRFFNLAVALHAVMMCCGKGMDLTPDKRSTDDGKGNDNTED